MSKLRELRRRAAKARAAKLSPERRSEIARMGGFANRSQSAAGKARAKKLSRKRIKEIARAGGLARAAAARPR